jgi:hypothetical protein
MLSEPLFTHHLDRISPRVFRQITPSTTLEWTACYTGAQCARFEVPLDYHNTTAGTAAIAVVKIPSTLSPQDANYKGPVLFNPGEHIYVFDLSTLTHVSGGPGSSGVDFVNGKGASFRQIYGPAFDLIGFDPRCALSHCA